MAGARVTHVTVHEVGPRDGLQNEPGIIGTPEKIALIRALAAAGLRRIEVGSFVSPRWVPQMADTADVLGGVPEGPAYDVLVPNMAGWERFVAARRPDTGIAVFVAATEGFSRANLNCSIAESIDRLRPVVTAAVASGARLRGYLSVVTDCPFEGAVAPQQVARVAAQLRALAPMPLSLGETLGRGQPARVADMLDAVAQVVPVSELAGHFHDTGGQALAAVEVALEKGLRAFDAAAGGLGGCPYAPGAPGNLATEALVALLHGQGYTTGVDAGLLAKAAELAKTMKGSGDGPSAA